MWDVIWTDPDRELVGEHRARKVKDEAQTKKHKNQSGRNSVSTTSSRSSADSPFSIFRARGLKRVTTSGSNDQTTSSASSGLESPSLASIRSPLSRTFEEESHPSPSGHISTSLFERRTNIDSPLDNSPVPDKANENCGQLTLSLSNHGSIFSTSLLDEVTIASSADDGAMPESEKMKSLIQIFENSSFVSKRDEIPLSSSGNVSSPQAHGGEAISTKKPCSFTPPMSPTKASTSVTNPKLGSPIALVPPTKSPLRLTAPKWHLPVMPNNLGAWRPPDKWDSVPSKSQTDISTKPNAEPLPATQCNIGPGVLTLELLQTEALRMATTSTPNILSRLKELWVMAGKKDQQFLLGDSKDVEEIRRWMLSTLIHLDHQPGLKSNTAPCNQSPMTARMVLALYDSQATVTHLAALYPMKRLYHISALPPIPCELFPNIHAITVSSISPTEFPVAPRLSESVHSLSLPALCPSTLLPSILKNVYKCLKIGGAFRLTLVDPLPRAGTMGIKMRAWIEKHLLHNLAKQSRCMSPSTLFQSLLGEAGLRGKGSTLTSTKFYAIPDSAVIRERDPDISMEKLQAEREAKAQVRSLVGRMLWVEVWGPYVTADKWWWEEPACVEECLELGTFWEYHTIKGVKGD